MAESRGRVCIFTLEAPSCHHEGERGEASFSLGGAGGGLPCAQSCGWSCEAGETNVET